MGEEIIGADKEAVIVCYHREGGYASYRKVQGGLAPPSRVLINPECETRLRIVRREQKGHSGSMKQPPISVVLSHNRNQKNSDLVHSVLSDRRSCSAQTPPAEVLVSLVVGVLFLSFPPPVYKSEKMMKVNCRRSESLTTQI